MKIAITGHTKGIGKAIAGLYYTDEVVGFSRSNGYDISDISSIDSIVNASLNCEVFVNNAYYGTAQVDIFEKLLASQSGTRKGRLAESEPSPPLQYKN